MQIPAYYIGQIQGIIFIFFIIGSYYLARIIYPLSKIFFLMVGICGLSSVAYTYGTIGDPSTSVLVSILKDDSTGALSRKLRLEIEKTSDLIGGETVKQIFTTSQSERTVKAINNNDSLFIVSGDDKWLKLTFNKEIKYTNLPVAEDSPYPALGKLSIITDITEIGLPLKPLAATAKFIGYLSSHEEIGWSLAGQQESTWTTRSHRAYPWFRQGTEYMKDIFNNRIYEAGNLDCAYQSFEQALRYASPLDARFLRMAISNNLGVLMYAQSLYEQSPQYRQKARKNIKWATYGFPKKRTKGVKYVGNVAKKNITILNKIENRKVKRSNGKRKGNKRASK